MHKAYRHAVRHIFRFGGANVQISMLNALV